MQADKRQFAVGLGLPTNSQWQLKKTYCGKGLDEEACLGRWDLLDHLLLRLVRIRYGINLDELIHMHYLRFVVSLVSENKYIDYGLFTNIVLQKYSARFFDFLTPNQNNVCSRQEWYSFLIYANS